MLQAYQPNEAETKLITALRSGNYKQTYKVLRDKDGFCCLGVACDISGRGVWSDSNQYHKYVVDGIMNEFILPDPVLIDLTWVTKEGMLIISDRDNVGMHLAELNDEGFTFNMIADVIQAGLVQHTGDA